ncbi:thioredoxin domain-containing protein, partial [Thermodesulfobacteriota bacterium]
AMAMAENTLIAMRLGGIYDHIGFGFHRYSTDEKWLLPHFEKMLYDQALLALAYLEGYQATGNPLFNQTAQEIFTYVLRDMTASEGGFYSAEDADSEGVEGKFYVWNFKYLEKTLSPGQFDHIRTAFNVISEGNFRDEATGKKDGANIFYLTKPMSGIGTDSTKGSKDIKIAHELIREKLFDIREKRIHPHKDDKILTDWNGLMIGALAFGARVLGSREYLKAAADCAGFILTTMRDNDKKLLHRYRDGESAVNGLLNDYAFLVWGLLELYETAFDPHILQEAVSLNELMLDLFWDEDEGGFFLTPEDGEALLIRPKEIYDGALPSGNSIALSNLLRLERMTANKNLSSKSQLAIQAFSGALKEVPSGYTQFMASLYFSLSASTEIVIVGDPQAKDTREMLSIIGSTFSPTTITLVKDSTSDNNILSELAPYTASYTSKNGKATAYVCRNYSCESPTTDPDDLRKFLQN